MGLDKRNTVAYVAIQWKQNHQILAMFINCLPLCVTRVVIFLISALVWSRHILWTIWCQGQNVPTEPDEYQELLIPWYQKGWRLSWQGISTTCAVYISVKNYFFMVFLANMLPYNDSHVKHWLIFWNQAAYKYFHWLKSSVCLSYMINHTECPVASRVNSDNYTIQTEYLSRNRSHETVSSC